MAKNKILLQLNILLLSIFTSGCGSQSIRPVSLESKQELTCYPLPDGTNLEVNAALLIKSLPKCSKYFPIPIGLLQSNSGNIAYKDFSKITLSQPPRISIDTPYFKDDQVVHPIFLDFNGYKVNGYKFWLGITPYRNAQNKYENPTIYESNEYENFQLINKFKEPLVGLPQKKEGADQVYNSDINFSYDPHYGDLIMLWRTVNSLNGNRFNRLFDLRYMTTKDGLKWTSEKILFPNSYNDIILSPSLLYNSKNKKWYLYYVGTKDDKPVVMYRTANSLNTIWSDAVVLPAPQEIQPWHLEARFVADKTILLIDDNYGSHNLYFAFSDDGDNFKFIQNPLLKGKFLAPYKASFSPIYEKNGRLALNMYWTSSAAEENGSNSWQLFHNKIYLK